MVWYPVLESGECVEIGAKSPLPYEEITCLYPSLKPMYMSWEFWYRPYWLWELMENNDWFPVFAVTVYFFLIKGGQRYFKNKPAWDLRMLMAVWNLFLAVFSAVGFTRMFPLLVHNLTTYTLKDNLCESPFHMIGFGTSGLWIAFFTVSKFFELFDTFFIVVHKKPLLFLHWYHHITVLLNCWHTWRKETATGIIFCVVNFGVHAVMYSYYFLMAIKAKPKWFSAKWITIAQILQMVIGVGTTLRAWAYLSFDDGCNADLSNILLTLGMYASYLVLFSSFFVDRYVFKARKTKTV